MIRRLLLVGAGLLGAALVGIDARWTGEEALEFRWSLYGRLLWQGDRGELGSAIERAAPAALVGCAGLALLLGFAGARAFGRRALVVAALFALFLLASLDPATLQFLATRGAESAGRYLDAGDLVRAAGWGWIAVCLIGAWAKPRDAAERLEPAASASSASRERAWVATACAIAGLLPALLSHTLLDGEPVTNDEVAYRYQAELFAGGELRREIGPYSDFFPARQILPGPSAFSKYPPAHSALLAIGALIGVPRLVPGLLAALVPLMTWLIARRLGLRRPHRAALLVAVSPVFLGVETLGLSHATSVPACLFFAHAVLAALDDSRAGKGRAAVLRGLAGGAAISIAFGARPLTAAAFALPFAIHFLAAAGPGTLAVCGAAVLGFLPGAVAFAWVNLALTGSAFESAYGMYAAAVSPNDRWGLVNLETALPTTRFNLARLGAWLHGLVPGLWLVVVGATSSTRPRRVHLLWLPSLFLLAFYALHRFHGVPWVGPLYLVEAVPLLVVLSAEGWNAIEARWGGGAARALGCVVLLSAAQLLSGHLVLAGEQVELRATPRRLARESGIERGVVFVPLEDEVAWKRFPMPPPRPSESLVFARDLPGRNAELLAWLGNPPAWRFEAQRGELVPISP